MVSYNGYIASLVPFSEEPEKLSLKCCRNVCQYPEFKERFKVLKQLSGKIKHQIRRFYHYCSKCEIFLRGLKNCQCCGVQLRKKLGYDRRAKYEANNKEKRRGRNNKNREKYLAYQRAYYYSHKKQ